MVLGASTSIRPSHKSSGAALETVLSDQRGGVFEAIGSLTPTILPSKEAPINIQPGPAEIQITVGDFGMLLVKLMKGATGEYTRWHRCVSRQYHPGQRHRLLLAGSRYTAVGKRRSRRAGGLRLERLSLLAGARTWAQDDDRDTICGQESWIDMEEWARAGSLALFERHQNEQEVRIV
jgi:hypothetical protein